MAYMNEVQQCERDTNHCKDFGGPTKARCIATNKRKGQVTCFTHEDIQKMIKAGK